MKKVKKANNVIINEKSDLVIVLYKYIRSTSNELTHHKNEYLMVPNYNVDVVYVFDYKKYDHQKKLL